MVSKKQVTVCFPLNNNQLLLVLINYGNGIQKWNGIGGVVEIGEKLEDGLAREMEEEIGAKVDRVRFTKKLTLTKFDKENNQEFDLNIYTLTNFSDNFSIIDPSIKEYRWFEFNQIPYNEMWPDNKEWLPKILS